MVINIPDLIILPRQPDEGFEYFTRIWVRMLQAADRQWLETPQDAALAPGLLPYEDIAPRIYERCVYGYVAFGTWGDESKAVWGQGERTDHIIWQSHQFINWKEQQFNAPSGTNALRVWLRTSNRAIVLWQTQTFGGALSAALLKTPPQNPGGTVYQSRP